MIIRCNFTQLLNTKESKENTTQLMKQDQVVFNLPSKFILSPGVKLQIKLDETPFIGS